MVNDNKYLRKTSRILSMTAATTKISFGKPSVIFAGIDEFAILEFINTKNIGVNHGAVRRFVVARQYTLLCGRLARVNLQLLETHTYSLLWSSSFEVKLQSPFQAQALIAKRVSIEINKAA